MTAKRLFSSRSDSFGSLVSLTVVTFFGVLYFLALPGFLSSTVGKVYAVIWAVIGLTIALAHGLQLLRGRRNRERQKLYGVLAQRPVRSRRKVYQRAVQY